MRAAVLVPAFPSLSETFVSAHVEGLRARGWNVAVFAHRRGDGFPPDDSRLEASYWRAPPQGRLRQRAGAAGRAALAVAGRRIGPGDCARALRRREIFPWYQIGVVKDRSFAIAHAHFGESGSLALKLRSVGAIRCPLVTTFHGYDVCGPLTDGMLDYAELFAEGDAFVASSKFLTERLAGLGCPADRIHRIPLGVEVGSRPTVREVPEHVVSVGRLVEVKGIEYGIRSFARLASQYPGLRYTIVGDGPLREGLQDLARGLGVESRVRFAGALSHARALETLASADVVLHPSVRSTDGREEGQGLAVLEAQAAGVPVVATRTGGLPESLLDGRSGLLVSERSESELAGALETILRSADLRRGMGIQAQEFVRREFDAEVSLDRLLALYSELDGGGS